MSRRLLLTLAAAALAAAGCVAPRAAGPEPVRLRVLSYNIHHGQGGDGVFDLERLATVIADAAPDLVALQEVDQGTGRAGGVRQADELARSTGLHGAFGRAMRYDGGDYGEAALSRAKPQAVDAWPLPAGPGREPRCALVLRCTGAAGPFLFVATHLDHTRGDEDRIRQIEEILARLAAGDRLPVILAGDLNCEPGSAPLARLGPDWLDAPLAAGAAAPTFPAPAPARRIDHVLVAPAARWRVLGAAVLDERIASDHRPLVVDLELLPVAE